MTTKQPATVRRPGFSFLELQVAFLLLAIALAGLGPLVVMQSKQLRTLESRLDHQATHYLVPASSPWARKLGVPASIETEDPGPASSPPVTLIDDADPGYSERDEGTVDWTTLSRPLAVAGEVRHQNGGSAGDTAIWDFTGIEPGWYEVLVTYDAAALQATDAPYTVFDGTAPEATVPVDQTVAPSGPTFAGVAWESLGTLSIASNALKVELSDYANGDIIADAVRIVPVRNVVQVTSLEKWLTGEEVTAHASVTVQTP